LNGIVPIRGLYVNFRTQFACAFHELIAVVLPSLQLQGIEGNANPYRSICAAMLEALATDAR
jgi:hypothetical protein